jgi:hypothetical protein
VYSVIPMIPRKYVHAMRRTDIDDRKQAEERMRNENLALREEIDRSSMYEALAERATAVETEWAPISEVPQQTPRSESDDSNLHGLTLDMKTLAEMPKSELIACVGSKSPTAFGSKRRRPRSPIPLKSWRATMGRPIAPWPAVIGQSNASRPGSI